jgi:hypothetical protein
MTVAQDIRRITESLFAWQAYEPAVKCDLSSCALATDDGLIFVDPIELAEPSRAQFLGGRRAAAIVLTNGNHVRAAAAWRTRLGTRIFAAANATDLELTPDVNLADGDILPGGMRVLSLPGAGPGEIALIGNGVACIGDALVNLPPEGLRLLPSKYCADPVELGDSLKKLLSYQFEVMTFAHGAPLVGSGRRRLEQLLA